MPRPVLFGPHKCHQNRIRVVSDNRLGTVHCCSVCGSIVPVIEIWNRQPLPKTSNLPWVPIYRVSAPGKTSYDFPHFWVAVSFAVYAFKHPQVMAERL